jgi:hypothetical protein
MLPKAFFEQPNEAFMICSILSATDREVVPLILRMARENRWGDDRIEGELTKRGYQISHETIRKILRCHRIAPLPTPNTGTSWRPFLSHY